jgi:hypothetical protein
MPLWYPSWDQGQIGAAPALICPFSDRTTIGRATAGPRNPFSLSARYSVPLSSSCALLRRVESLSVASGIEVWRVAEDHRVAETPLCLVPSRRGHVGCRRTAETRPTHRSLFRCRRRSCHPDEPTRQILRCRDRAPTSPAEVPQTWQPIPVECMGDGPVLIAGVCTPAIRERKPAGTAPGSWHPRGGPAGWCPLGAPTAQRCRYPRPATRTDRPGVPRKSPPRT